MWNFDEAIPREKTNCIKYDWREKVFGKADIIPMWVADMDFKTPHFIIEAIENRLRHEILGYSFRSDGYYSSLINWISRRHAWNIRKEWVEFSPGVVPALSLCTLAFTDLNEEIIIQPPVYTPFHNAVIDHNRRLLYNNLLKTGGGYVMDYEGLRKLVTPKTRMIIISNPHNPVGRAWRREELEKLIDICYEKKIIIISDEIHSDLMLDKHTHIPLASLSDRAAEITITCMAPSKTFNLAGLSTSSMIIPDTELRNKYRNVLERLHLHLGNVVGNIASEAAYTYGDEWLDELLRYVQTNVEMVTHYCHTHLLQIKPILPEATYMIWLDCRDMRMTGSELERFFVEKAGIGLNEGSAFGPGGEGFMRMNLACPHSIVERALNNIKEANNRTT